MMSHNNESREQHHDDSETSAVDKEATAAYDMRDMSAPRVSGIVARILVFAVENRFLGPPLKRKLLKDSGFIAFHERTEIHPEALRYPLHFPLPESLETPLEFPDVDRFFQSLWNKNDNESYKRCSVRDYVTAYQSGSVSPVHVCDAVLQQIQSSNDANPPLRAVTAVNEELARSEATLSAERWRNGCPISILDGIPLIVKDMIAVKDYSMTGGVGYLVLSPPPADTKDATTVAALRKAGMIVVGKANTDEIGMGVRGYNRYLGQARNPWDLNRVPGGSSSGCGAAVAAGLSPIALGSDGGGSVRIPAACCGVFGLKPTFARLSSSGRFWDNDQRDDEDVVPSEPPTTMSFGPIALCADDLALAYFVLSSHAAHGPIVGWLDFQGNLIDKLPDKLDGSVEGLRIGVCKPWIENASTTASIHFRRALSALESAGAVINPIVIPSMDDMRCAHVIAISSNTYKLLKSNSAMRDENWPFIAFDTRLKMVTAGEFDEEYVAKADSVRARAVHTIVKDMFAQVDVVLTPALGADVPEVPENLNTGLIDPATDSQMMRFMTFANFTGVPAATIPVGLDEKNGMPYSVQAIAGPWQEVLLLQICKFLEDNLSPKAACPSMAFNVLSTAAKL